LSYTSLVGSFVYKDPVFASKLDTLAENDDFLKDNGWATSTKTAFFQASAPTGWTKDITAALDGKILRVVSGAGGGTGGSFDIAGTITLIIQTQYRRAAHIITLNLIITIKNMTQ